MYVYQKMGGFQSSYSEFKNSWNQQRAMTVPEILGVLSRETDELKETIINTKQNKMPDTEMRQYLFQLLQDTEERIQKIKASISPGLSTGQDYRLQNGNYVETRNSQRPYKEEAEFTSLRDQLAKTQRENAKLRSSIDQYEEKKSHDLQIIDRLADQNEKLKEDKQYLLNRLSQLTAEKLTANNPNIADLSDPNRPTKLVEMMSELYDNEWTNAFVELKCRKTNEKTVVTILLNTFLDVFNFCQQKSISLITLTEKSVTDIFEDLHPITKEKGRLAKVKSATLLVGTKQKESESTKTNLEPLDLVFMDWVDDGCSSELEESTCIPTAEDVWSDFETQNKKLRKQFGTALIPLVTKAYLKPRWSKSSFKTLKPYIKRCVHVAWLMCVQIPPMRLVPNPRPGDKFDTSMYSAYSKSGPIVDYAVWPAVLLTEPKSTEKPKLMRRGVAEGRKI